MKIKFNAAKFSYVLNILLIMIIANGVQNFFLLKDAYEKNLITVLEKVNAIEKDLDKCVNKSVVSPKGNIEALRSYIAIKFPKVPIGDVATISNEINKQCLANSVPFSVVVGIIEVESSFRKNAKSKKGAFGLMQIRYNTWKEELNLRNKKELFNIRKNISVGISILKCYIDKNNGDIIEALKDYAGANNEMLPKKVNRAVGEFTLFRTAYVNNTEVINIEKERTLVNADVCKISKDKGKSSPKLRNGKRSTTSASIQHKHKVIQR